MVGILIEMSEAKGASEKEKYHWGKKDKLLPWLNGRLPLSDSHFPLPNVVLVTFSVHSSASGPQKVAIALYKLAALIASILVLRATGGFQFKILGHHSYAGLKVKTGLGCFPWFSIIHSRFIQAVVCSNRSFFFIAEKYFVVSAHDRLFIHLLKDIWADCSFWLLLIKLLWNLCIGFCGMINVHFFRINTQECNCWVIW